MSDRKFWTTRTGDKLRIKDLTSSHLQNILLFLERAKFDQDSHMAYSAALAQGEMASYYADQEAENAAKETVGERFPIYADLCKEAKRRKLITRETK